MSKTIKYADLGELFRGKDELEDSAFPLADYDTYLSRCSRLGAELERSAEVERSATSVLPFRPVEHLTDELANYNRAVLLSREASRRAIPEIDTLVFWNEVLQDPALAVDGRSSWAESSWSRAVESQRVGRTIEKMLSLTASDLSPKHRAVIYDASCVLEEQFDYPDLRITLERFASLREVLDAEDPSPILVEAAGLSPEIFARVCPRLFDPEEGYPMRILRVVVKGSGFDVDDTSAAIERGLEEDIPTDTRGAVLANSVATGPLAWRAGVSVQEAARRVSEKRGWGSPVFVFPLEEVQYTRDKSLALDFDDLGAMLDQFERGRHLPCTALDNRGVPQGD